MYDSPVGFLISCQNTPSPLKTTEGPGTKAADAVRDAAEDIAAAADDDDDDDDKIFTEFLGGSAEKQLMGGWRCP